MAAPRTPMDLIRTLADHLFPRRSGGDVIGHTNGILTVAVDNRVVNVEYAGTDELLSGYKVWLRQNPDDPHGGYTYDGPRLEAGSVHFSPRQTNVRVRQQSVDDHVVVRVIDGNTATLIAPRRYLQFEGAAVTVTDDPTNDKVIITIGSALPMDVDYDDASVDYDDPVVGYGG